MYMMNCTVVGIDHLYEVCKVVVLCFIGKRDARRPPPTAIKKYHSCIYTVYEVWYKYVQIHEQAMLLYESKEKENAVISYKPIPPTDEEPEHCMLRKGERHARYALS